MAITTKRRFTDEFKREAVALWETSGRMQTEVAAELGIMPTMLRRWQRKLGDGSAVPAGPAAKPPVSAMASPADQASEIARLRLADITYIATGEGWLYLAAVLDLATRKIVGWAEQPKVPAMRSVGGMAAEGMRDHMRTELPLAAMMMAAQRQRPAPGLICHSDRGSQYAAGAYVDYLSAIRAVPSMSRTGNCYDNAPMERFFHTLKVELVHQCRWATQAEARQALFGYIEGYYNRHRMHSALGYLTPEQAEQRMTG